jgi:peptidoglycan/xylan/chitin deacetylase (PgdA/CDA1 family)
MRSVDRLAPSSAVPAAARLYATNTPANLWRFLTDPEPSAADWTIAIRTAASRLPEAARADDIETLLYLTLGEGQFGPGHWELGSAKRLYYLLKPALPRWSTRLLRRGFGRSTGVDGALRWPIEARYAEFQWEVARALLRRTGKRALPFINFWPNGHRYAFVLTHDVETAAGQDQVAALAELDASYGFRSSFNFVPERYAVDHNLLAQLRTRGFEIGVHGLKHDGKLFSSYQEFIRRAQSINRYLKDFGAVGFRAPLTHRNPVWMQTLEIDYDLSFFDTDPYEPISGGTMSLWPFEIGRFVELPYTLVQDYTLTEVLRETTPRLWLEKADFIRGYGGLVLVNTHPDYLKNPITRSVYVQFLAAMRRRSDFWQALPMEVASWWRARSQVRSPERLDGAVESLIDEAGTIRLPADTRTVIAAG